MRLLPRRVRELSQANAGWWALLAAGGLSLIGICAMATLEETEGGMTAAAGGRAVSYAQYQGVWLGIALGVMLLVTLPRARQIGLATWPLTILITLVLAVMVVPGMPRSVVPVINGTRAWIDLKYLRLQPSELAKIAYVLALARYLRHSSSYRTLPGLLLPFVIMLLPVGLILLEPDMGTAVLFFPVLLAMLVAAGAKLRHLAAIVGLAVLVVGLNIAAVYLLPERMQLLKPHQAARIKATISRARGETRYLKDVGFQQDKAVTLTAAGGMLGLGKERAATLIKFNHLPEDHNDMILAVVAARWGVAGSWLTLGLYAVLIGSMLAVAARQKDPFGRLACVGFAALIFSQTVINMGMATGMLPVIGITLPFVSYGGSSLLAGFIMVGLVLNFASQRPSIITRPSFEFDNSERIFQ